MSNRNDRQHAADRYGHPTGESRADLAMEFPAFAGRLVLSGRHGVCYVHDREVRIEAPGKLLAQLVRLCDGRTPMSEIVAELEQAWSKGDLTDLIDDLAEQGVLCEASRLAEHWWTFFDNPAAFRGPASSDRASSRSSTDSAARQAGEDKGFAGLLKRRSSIRTFGSAPIPYSILLSIYWASYGVFDRRTVPSAGGFYPLEIHWINLRRTDGLDAGIYRLSFPGPGEVRVVAVDEDLTVVARAFMECDLLFNAQGVMVVSGNLGEAAVKYGTRATLYVPLEAGHVAQNVLLSATESGVAAVEVGGFYKKQLAALLKLADGHVPLTSIFLGSAPSDEEMAGSKGAPDIQYLWLETDQPPYVPPFFVCAARIDDREGDWSWGRSADPATAHVKASAEAQERWSCMQPSGLREACLHELDHAVDPRTIIAYSSQQYDREDFPYRPFQPEGAYSWKEGIDVGSGKPRAVLADCLYFGGTLDHPCPYTDATSSGAAAYPARQGAMERAVLELIERDGFMRAWLSRAARPTVEAASLPQAIRKRVQDLRQVGVDVVFKSLSSDLAPAILAFAQSPGRGFTIATASAAFDAEEALNNALMELEQSVAMRLANAGTHRIEPADVCTPADHMDLYGQRRYYKRADFLARGGRETALLEVGADLAANWSELCGRLDKRGQPVIWVDLTPAGAGLYGGRVPLTIGRAIVPGLIPITFGHGREPLASFDRQSSAARHRRGSGKSTAVPYLFPHPFG